MVTSRPVEMIVAGPRSPGPGLGPVVHKSLVKNPAHRGDLHTSLPSHLTPPSRVRDHPRPRPPAKAETSSLAGFLPSWQVPKRCFHPASVASHS